MMRTEEEILQDIGGRSTMLDPTKLEMQMDMDQMSLKIIDLERRLEEAKKANWFEANLRLGTLARALKLMDGLNKYRGQINLYGENSAAYDIDNAMEVSSD